MRAYDLCFDPKWVLDPRTDTIKAKNYLRDNGVVVKKAWESAEIVQKAKALQARLNVQEEKDTGKCAISTVTQSFQPYVPPPS